MLFHTRDHVLLITCAYLNEMQLKFFMGENAFTKVTNNFHEICEPRHIVIIRPNVEKYMQIY